MQPALCWWAEATPLGWEGPLWEVLCSSQVKGPPHLSTPAQAGPHVMQPTVQSL